MKSVVLDPGRMTARLTRLVPVDVPDGQGGAQRSWQAADQVWAQVEPVSCRTDIVAGAQKVTVTHRIWLSFQAGPSVGERLAKGDRRFTIKAVRDPDETRRFLVCDCEEEAT